MIIFKDTVQMLAPLENQSKFPRSSSFPAFSFLLPFYLGICFLIKLYRLHENRGHILFILGSHSRFPSTGTDDLQPCWILYLWLNPIKKCMYMYSFSYFTVAYFYFMAAVTICSDFGAPKIKSDIISTVSPSIYQETMGPDAMFLVFWMLSFKPTFSLSSFTSIKRLFSSSSLIYAILESKEDRKSVV